MKALGEAPGTPEAAGRRTRAAPRPGRDGLTRDYRLPVLPVAALVRATPVTPACWPTWWPTCVPLFTAARANARAVPCVAEARATAVVVCPCAAEWATAVDFDCAGCETVAVVVCFVVVVGVTDLVVPPVLEVPVFD